MTKQKHIFRTVLLTLLTLVCATVYYHYIAMIYEAKEFKNPAGKNTSLFQKHKFTYNLLSLPSRMTYYLLSPDPYYSDVKYPLLVVLHGGTGKAYAAGFMAENYYREKYPGFVLVPVTPPGHIWSSPHSDPTPYKNALPYVVKLVRNISETLSIDKGRVYIMGCSMGGGGSIISSLYYQDVFAAASAMGAYFIPEYMPQKPVTPLVIIHGTHDADAPVEAIRATVSIIKNAGGTVYYEEYKDAGHNCPMEFFYPEAMWNWLYAQSKPYLRK